MEPSREADGDSNPIELQIHFESSKHSSRMTDQEFVTPIDDVSQEIASTSRIAKDTVTQEYISNSIEYVSPEIDFNPQLVGDPKDLRNHFESSKVIPPPLQVVVGDVVSKELSELVQLLIELLEIRLVNGRTSSMTDIGLNSMEILEICGAQQVFVEMPKREVVFLTELEYKNLARSDESFRLKAIDNSCSKLASMEQIISSLGDGLRQDSITLPYDRGKWMFLSCYGHKLMACWPLNFKTEFSLCYSKALIMFDGVVVAKRILVFDPGGSFDDIEWEIGEDESLLLCGAQVIRDHLILIFYPGGEFENCCCHRKLLHKFLL